MSTIVAPPVTRIRLRLTARGRRVLAALVCLPLAVFIALAVLAPGGAAASGTAAPAGQFATVVVSGGDSLWGIAQRIAPHADPRDVVDAIITLNGLDSALVTPGQSLAIPARYTPAG